MRLVSKMLSNVQCFLAQSKSLAADERGLKIGGDPYIVEVSDAERLLFPLSALTIYLLCLRTSIVPSSISQTAPL